MSKFWVELMCNEDIGIEYGIQANGEEAKELCKEINWFTMAATSPSRYAHKEAEESVKTYISRRAAWRTGEVKVSEESNWLYDRLLLW